MGAARRGAAGGPWPGGRTAAPRTCPAHPSSPGAHLAGAYGRRPSPASPPRHRRRHRRRIHSLPTEWLWCESWCGNETKSAAKTIDLCNNPKTKEPKLAAARRIVPEWVGYDAAQQRFTDWVDALAAAEAEGVDVSGLRFPDLPGGGQVAGAAAGEAAGGQGQCAAGEQCQADRSEL